MSSKLTPAAERNRYGAWVVSDIVGGYHVHRQFYGYTKAESVRMFREGFEK